MFFFQNKFYLSYWNCPYTRVFFTYILDLIISSIYSKNWYELFVLIEKTCSFSKRWVDIARIHTLKKNIWKNISLFLFRKYSIFIYFILVCLIICMKIRYSKDQRVELSPPLTCHVTKKTVTFIWQKCQARIPSHGGQLDPVILICPRQGPQLFFPPLLSGG